LQNISNISICVILSIIEIEKIMHFFSSTSKLKYYYKCYFNCDQNIICSSFN